MKLKMCLLFLIISVFSNASLRADLNTDSPDDDSYPRKIFYNFGNNWLGSFTHNYGANFIGAGLGTWAMIETGLDWDIRNKVGETPFFRHVGMPSLLVGMLMPAVTPLSFYLLGKKNSDDRMVGTAAALTQSLIITLSIQSPLKMITGRPGTENPMNTWGAEERERKRRTEDFSNEFDWFNMNFAIGWPSGHTATAFAAAAVLYELYDDKPLLVFCAYAYAAAMGICMATSVHWASDVLAGALIGQAVGRTVGRSYARPHGKAQDVSLNFFGNAIGVNLRL
ncbi:MAG: phosphatase PAP2 family protein [Spirochaetaceae bacterium]|nr:phosphatase PAP2 family protein [Spirochaetaceae bacterium]